MSPQYMTVGGYPNTDPYYVSPEEEAAMADRKNPLHPMFRSHNCWRCKDGEKPCINKRGPHDCEYPHARND